MKDCCKKTIASVPDDEPIFALLGRDLTAIPRINDWIEEARRIGVNPGKVERAKQHLQDFIEFQRDHPERCKYPD